MVPYFVVGGLYIPLKIVFVEEVNTEIIPNRILADFLSGANPNYQLWTLYALFLCALFVTLFKGKKESNYKILLSCSIVLFYIGTIYTSPYLIIREVLKELPFYLLGLMFGRRQIELKGNKWVIAFAGITLVGLNALNFYMEGQKNNLLLFSGVAGILAICEIAKSKEIINMPIFDLVGKYSMDIYVMGNIVQVTVRSVFLNYLQFNEVICCLLSTTLGILLPILVSKYIVRRIGVAKMLILGEYKR